MSNFAIGCLHLGHENMAKHRGFIDSYEYHIHLVERWNSVVNKRDKVFILGDISMESKEPYGILSLLNGYKHVVLGNHDRGNHVLDLLKYVDKVSGPVKHKGCWFTHIPVHPIEFNYRVKYNFHAHIHDIELNDNRYYHTDAHKLGYKPLNLDFIY